MYIYIIRENDHSYVIVVIKTIEDLIWNWFEIEIFKLLLVFRRYNYVVCIVKLNLFILLINFIFAVALSRGCALSLMKVIKLLIKAILFD